MKGFNFDPALRLAAIAVCGLYLSVAEAESFSGKVVGVADGDTLTVLTGEKQQNKVRRAEIDAPEKHQPFGTRSKQSLSDLCFGKQAEIIPFAKDRYKRTVARVKCAGIDANAAQVNSGMAWVYRQYARDVDLYALERTAIIDKRGLWADPSPVPPWEFRRRLRKNVRPL